MMFPDLKVGDSVFIVRQQGLRGGERKTETAQVSRIGRKYGYVERYHRESPFSLETGASHHPGEDNTRTNGYGFDVYPNEEAYRQKCADDAAFARLQPRLVDRLGLGRVHRFSPEVVTAIHELLDREGLE